MIPGRFDYAAPDSLQDAIGTRADGGEDAKLLADICQGARIGLTNMASVPLRAHVAGEALRASCSAPRRSLGQAVQAGEDTNRQRTWARDDR